MSQTLVKPINSDSEFGLPPTFILKVYDPRFYFFRSKSPTRRNPEFNDFYISKEDDYVGWEEYLLLDCGAAILLRKFRIHPTRFMPGIVIPRCFGAGELQLCHFVSLILLEYIPDAQRLDTVNPNTVSFPTARSLADAAQMLDDLGISHRDYHPGSILFS